MMKIYFLNLKFTFKVGSFMAFAGMFIFLNALIPKIPIPQKFNLHSVINRVAYWFSEIEQCRKEKS